MNLIKNDIQSFAMAVFNTYDLSKIKIDRNLALTFLRKQTLEDFEELNLVETMVARHQHFKVGNVTAEFPERGPANFLNGYHLIFSNGTTQFPIMGTIF